jgi:hypothetical protein
LTSGASQRGCGLRPVTRESRTRPQGTPYAGADIMQTSRGVAAGLRAQARDPRVPAVGSVLATLAAAQGAPAAPIRLHECGRSTSAGAKAPGSTSACTGRRHHVRQRVGHGTLVYTKAAGTHSSTRMWPQYVSRRKGPPAARPPAQVDGTTSDSAWVALNCTVLRVASCSSSIHTALWQQPSSGLAQSWVCACSSSIEAGTSGLRTRLIKPSRGGPAQS